MSLQYRVGAFGFFYQGNDEAPGNMGLYDQVIVLVLIMVMVLVPFLDIVIVIPPPKLDLFRRWPCSG